MERAINKTFRKPFKKLPYGNSFVNEYELGPELDESNCTPELWDVLKHHETPVLEDPKSTDAKPFPLCDASMIYENMINDHLDNPNEETA
jgi:hypothetical protein